MVCFYGIWQKWASTDPYFESPPCSSLGALTVSVKLINTDSILSCLSKFFKKTKNKKHTNKKIGRPVEDTLTNQEKKSTGTKYGPRTTVSCLSDDEFLQQEVTVKVSAEENGTSCPLCSDFLLIVRNVRPKFLPSFGTKNSSTERLLFL